MRTISFPSELARPTKLTYTQDAQLAMARPVVMPVVFGRRPVTTPDMNARYEAHYVCPATRYSHPLW